MKYSTLDKYGNV